MKDIKVNDQTDPRAFSTEEVAAAADRISNSGVLGSKSRIQQLLRYLVEIEIDGQGDRLKAFTIATEVFGRGDDFDPRSDSIVRVEVNRLRQALDHYYNTQGAKDPFRIVIPKGSYRPRFESVTETAREAPEPTEPTERKRTSRWVLAGAAVATLLGIVLIVVLVWSLPGQPSGSHLLERTNPLDRNAITVAVLPFKVQSESVLSTQFSGGLAKELRGALSRNQALSLITNIPLSETTVSEDLRTLGKSGRVAYFVTGSVQEVFGSLRVAVELVEGENGKVVWARTFQQETADLDAFRDGFVSAATREMRPQFYSASKRAIAAKDPDDLSAWELYLMATWAPGEAISNLAWEKERVELALRSIELRPQFGQAHAVLADKLAYLAAVDPPSNSDAVIEKAKQHAHTASGLAPGDADVLFNLGIHHWHVGQSEQATRDMARVLELDPNHVLAKILVRVFPYTCTAPPDEILEEAVAYDAALASDNPVRWVTLTWLSMLHLNRGELELALAAEQRTHQIFQTPDTVVRMAALLNGLNRVEEAKALIAAQQRNWPNIDPGHFAEVTMPRRCKEFAEASTTLKLYKDLARNVRLSE